MSEHEELSNKLVWHSSVVPHSQSFEFFMASFLDDGDLRESDCITFLSKPEVMQASKLTVADERRHYILRRWFQRQFVAKILNFKRPLGEMRLVHALDTRPSCFDAPDLYLSFSSSGPMMLACASRNVAVGVDIERKRLVENAHLLAERFFSSDEAAHIAALPEALRSHHFLFHWTAKEAALKAVGKGIDSGINQFQLRPFGQSGGYAIIERGESLDAWSLQFSNILTNYLIAVVHSKNNSTPS